MALKELISLDKRRQIANFSKEILTKFATSAYSQEGEDMILRRIFNDKKSGFFVDVGAFHPTRFSNTFYFYKQGWRGINIDAMPDSMNRFNKQRSRDINVEVPIASKKQSLKYFAFNEPALNTFFDELANERDGKDGYKVLFKKDIETFTLAEVLDKYMPKDVKEIDFFSIDVESLDYDVLISNDWNKYKPKIILIEDLKFDINNLSKSDIVSFLAGKDYKFLAKTVNTLFFKLNSFIIDE
jgi:FkbM family methyltransferase